MAAAGNQCCSGWKSLSACGRFLRQAAVRRLVVVDPAAPAARVIPKESVVKNAMRRAALVSMLAIAPVASFAQQANNNGALTRAQVRQEMIDLESVGYDPASANQNTYPQDVQAATQRLEQKRANEARLAQQKAGQAAPQTGASSGYGAQPAPAEASGGPAKQPAKPMPGSHDLYSHH